MGAMSKEKDETSEKKSNTNKKQTEVIKDNKKRGYEVELKKNTLQKNIKDRIRNRNTTTEKRQSFEKARNEEHENTKNAKNLKKMIEKEDRSPKKDKIEREEKTEKDELSPKKGKV